ncbi:MAG: primosomal protein N' [Clostridia bacterium]|nr:primosomal protein N' [Clostridia bacterium]
MKGNFAGVIINRLALNIDKIFHYSIPDELLGKINIGSHVTVPFGQGNKTVDGFVLTLDDHIDFDGKVKDILELNENAPLFNEEMLSVCDFLKRNYFCSYISAVKTILPPGSSRKNKVSDKIIQGSVLNVPYDEAFDALEKLRDKAPKQCRILELLIQNDFVADSDITYITGSSYQAINALKDKGLIRKETVEVLRFPVDYDAIPKEKPPVLTSEQEEAVLKISSSVEKGTNETFLLHGVTGSGKTEVFLNCIDSVLKCGKTAIVLVPEISLTPQMVTRFAARFGKEIAVLHSGLSMGERADEYKRIKNGDAKVVVGARSAVFAPLKNIGVIVIDEEHETSYKAENAPTYHAREVAEFRAKHHGAALVLASATPSVESYYRAKEGKYKLITLTKRPTSQNLPDVSVCDMREEMKNGNRSSISAYLRDEIIKNKENNEQTILFLNRRGFSNFVSCRSCGYVVKCENCDIALTYHKARGSLTCHYCGYTVKKPTVCPECSSSYIKEFGTGTQRVEEEIKELFPDISVIRMDVDTTNAKSSHSRILDTFDKEKIDILLGTQMVAKGLDFSNVTLVGVLAADQSLYIDDFRAGERTFDLITQVSGRAGRGDKKGRAVIQTYMPKNDIIQKAKNQDYLAFYENEILLRKQLNYPPFCDILSVLITSSTLNGLDAYAKKISDSLNLVMKKEYDGDYEILGPCEPSVPRINGRYRRRIWIKCKIDKKTEDIFARLRSYHINQNNAHINMVIENNPYSSI